MKRIFVTAALGLVCDSALAQGTLNFANVGLGWNAPVIDARGFALLGSGWKADLYWSAGLVLDSHFLTALGAPATFSAVPSEAGFFFGGTRTIPTAPGVITAQIRVWDANAASSWEQANASLTAASGASAIISVSLADSNATPTSMTELEHYHCVVSLGHCLDRPECPPILQSPVGVIMTTDALVLVWPTSGPSPYFTMQQNTDLNTTNWTTLTNQPVLVSQTNELDYQIFIPHPNVPTFYRLKSNQAAAVDAPILSVLHAVASL